MTFLWTDWNRSRTGVNSSWLDTSGFTKTHTGWLNAHKTSLPEHIESWLHSQNYPRSITSSSDPRVLTKQPQTSTRLNYVYASMRLSIIFKNITTHCAKYPHVLSQGYVHTTYIWRFNHSPSAYSTLTPLTLIETWNCLWLTFYDTKET